jgi:hypothetical protein
MSPSSPNKWQAFRAAAIDQHLSLLSEVERKELHEEKQRKRAKYKANREQKNQRNRRFMELLLRGYARAEIAKLTGSPEITVKRYLASVWPFPKPGRDYRYVLTKMAPSELVELDKLAEDYGVDRMRMFEVMLAYWLENGAAVARRDLRIPNR